MDRSTAVQAEQNQGNRRGLRLLGWVGLGLAAGILLGLYLGWVAWPTEYGDANPAVLADEYKQDYLIMTATLYAAHQDLDAARRGVSELGEEGRAFLNAYVLDQILRGNQSQDMRYLARLAHDLGLDSPALQPYLTDPEPTP